MKTMGRRIEKAMAVRGLDTQALAYQLGVTTQTVRAWTAGDQSPRWWRIPEIAAALQVKPTWILNGIGIGPRT